MNASQPATQPDITTAIKVLHTPGKVVEVRIPKSAKSKSTLSGWFDDPDKMAQAVIEQDGKHPAIYYSLNSVNPALLARCSNKIQTAKSTTSGPDILHRDWMLIDADPVRPSGISSTDAEKSAAKETLAQTVTYLTNQGWPSPVTADSGNGYHALYKLDLPNTPEVEVAVHGALTHLSKKFSDDKVKIDTAVSDPNRITKIYGTMTRKGEAKEDRPHRRSALRRVPDTIVPVTLNQLKALAPKKEGIHAIKSGQNAQNPKTKLPPVTVEKMIAFFDFYGLDYSDAKERPDGGLMWTVQECPFNPVHDYAVFLTEEGVPGFNCFHNSAACNEKHFKEYHQSLQEKTNKKFFFHTNVEVTPASAPTTTKLNVKKASEIKAELIRWLWKNRVAFGKVTLFVGMPGVGKGLATMDISSRVSTGSPFPDAPNPYPPMDVLIFSSEDDAADTLKPRLMAVKADLDRIGIVETVSTTDGTKQFSLDTDLPALREALVANPNIGLIIIDPLLNHMGELGGNKEQDVRAALTPLGMLAAEFKCAVIIVTHPNKRSEVEAICRVGGAMAVVGSTRSAWFFMESKEEEGVYHMVQVKTNLSNGNSGLTYQTVGEMVTIENTETEIGRIKWGSESQVSLQELMPSAQANSKIRKSEKCLTWMLAKLEKGPQPSAEMEATAIAEGFGTSTVKEVKKQLKVKSTSTGFGETKKWFWSLPTFADSSPTPSDPQPEGGIQ